MNDNKLICTRCGKQNLTELNDNEYICEDCLNIINKEKENNFLLSYNTLSNQNEIIDIKVLREYLYNNITVNLNKKSVTRVCNQILEYLKDDVVATFYLKYINKNVNKEEYINYLKELPSIATKSELNELANIIKNSIEEGEENYVNNIFKSINTNTKDINFSNIIQNRKELFNYNMYDIFICSSFKDNYLLDDIEKIISKEYTYFDNNLIPVDIAYLDYEKYNMCIKNAIENCNTFIYLSTSNSVNDDECLDKLNIVKKLQKNIFEYKINKNIYLPKNKYPKCKTPQDILIYMYNILEKNKILYNKAIAYLDEEDYQNAKTMFSKINDIDNYKLCGDILKVKKLIKDGNLDEAKEIIDSYKDNPYISIYSKLCKSEDDSEVNSIIKLVDIYEDYETAEKKAYQLLKYNPNNFDLWVYYLKAISLNYTSNLHENISLATNKLIEFKDHRDEVSKILNRVKYVNFDDLIRSQDIYKVNKYKDLDVFLCFSDDDKKLINQIVNELSNNDIKTHILTEDNTYGDRWTDYVKYICASQMVLFISTNNSQLDIKCKALLDIANKVNIKVIEYKPYKESLDNIIKTIKGECNLNNIKKYGYVYFGFFPQTIKDKDITILNKIDDNLFMGSDNNKYIKALLPHEVKSSENLTFSNGDSINKNVDYYFKVEPIKWKVLDIKDGKAFLFANRILFGDIFDKDSNIYSKSHIRNYLNNDFYNNSFSEKEKDMIENTTNPNPLDAVTAYTNNDNTNYDTIDKVFLLSEDELKNNDYVDTQTLGEWLNKEVTDYSKILLKKTYGEEGQYWSRTNVFNNKVSTVVFRDIFFGNVNECNGVVPALWIKLK